VILWRFTTAKVVTVPELK